MRMPCLCSIALVIHLSFLVCGETAMSQSPTVLSEQSAQVQLLREQLLDAADWKNAGFETPQATAQTFLWAMRERNANVVKECFDAPDKIDINSFEDDPDETPTAAKSLRALAIRRVDERTVDLKFEVTGCQTPSLVHTLVHRLKKTETGWKLEADSNTHEADW